MAAPDVTAYDAIVVGGGFAGLSAAVRLARGGARVLVLEARSRLGGRATAFQDRDSGEWVDNGQHVLLGCYRETLAFLREIGALDLVRVERELSVTMVDRDGVRSALVCPSIPAPWHLLAGACRWPALRWRDRFALLRIARPLRRARMSLGQPEPAGAAADETVERWLIRHGQNSRLREMLWHPLALAALNQPADVASAKTFIRVLAEMFAGRAEDAALVLPTRPLQMVFADPARRYLEQRGGLVKTGARASVLLSAGEVCVSEGGVRHPTRAVIAAVPWFALHDLFEGDREGLTATLDAAAQTMPSPIVTVNLWYDRVVLNAVLLGLPGRTWQWVFDKRAMWGSDAAHLSLVSSGASGVLAKTNDELVALADAEVRSALPEAHDARLLRGTVIREPRATFSLAPGQPRRPATETGIRGLWLAGDWIDTGLPATIESAVRSGHAAAEAALSALYPTPMTIAATIQPPN